MGCIGGWNCNPTTIDQWRGPLSNGTLLVGGAAPLANDGIAGWTGTYRSSCRSSGESSVSILYCEEYKFHEVKPLILRWTKNLLFITAYIYKVVLELQVRGPIQPTEKACKALYSTARKALYSTAWGSAWQCYALSITAYELGFLQLII
jgi:hypothetical protein